MGLEGWNDLGARDLRRGVAPLRNSGPEDESDRNEPGNNADGAQFQIMTMGWTPGGISITREGPGGSHHTETHTLSEIGDDLIPDDPHRLTIQLDAWEHSISRTVRMEVDWVEVYRYYG